MRPLVVLSVLLFAFLAPTVLAECYDAIGELPATCDGGTITADTVSGTCRTIECSSGANLIKVLACDKPDVGAKTHFELYRQDSSGSVPRLCLDETCIQSEGYKRSVGDYPFCDAPPRCTPAAEVCDGQDNDCDDLVDEGGVCGTIPPSNQTCYTNVQSMPVNCSSWGTITNDRYDGCRYITCSDTTGNYPGEYYVAKACDKPGSTNPTTIELYSAGRQGFAGTEICFGSACISTGIPFKSYSYPLCGANTTPPPTCTPSAEVCDQQDNDCDSQVDEDGVCAPSTNSTCYNSLNDLPANCTGTITSDVKAGGRTIACTGSGGSLEVQAWEKTDTTGKFFEINRKSATGTPPTLCIGNDCLKPGWGYERGDYFPVCTGNVTNTTPPTTCTYNNQTYQVNESFPAGDGCNTCTCGGNGHVLCTQQACPPPDYDYGRDSRFLLSEATINGDAVDWQTKTVTVAPGAPIDGTARLYYESRWPTGIGMAAGWTPTWGDHATSYHTLPSIPSNASDYLDVPIGLTAPTEPGEHWIVFAFRAEVDPGDVMSATNWAANPEVWNDGNDVAEWSHEQIATARETGRAPAQLLFTDGMRQLEVPSAALRIIVEEPGNETRIMRLLEYSAEHNQVFRCNVTDFTPTHYRWYVDGALVFEKNESAYPDYPYNRTHETFANYYHKFPGNGTYDVTCAADDGTSSANASRKVTITTRATPEEIAATEAVVIRPKITYLDDYEAKIEADVFGATRPAAWFQVNRYVSSESYTQIGIWPQQSGSHFEAIATFPHEGTYSVRFRGATSVEDEIKVWHNAGRSVNRGCFDGPRGGTPVCNADEKTLTIDVPYDPDVPTGIDVRHISGDTFEAVCHIPPYPGAYIYFNYPHEEPTYEGQPILFNTTESSGRASCTHTNGATDNAGHGTVTISEAVDFAALRGNTTPLPAIPPPTCFTTVQDLNASCQNSDLVSEQYVNGCMEYVCESGTGRIKVKACDKPAASHHPYWFEMYKTEKSGYGPNFCLGETCFANSDYAKSDIMPACLLAPDDDGWNEYMAGWSYSDGVYSTVNTAADVPVESYYAEGQVWDDYTVQVDMLTKSGYAPADSQLIFRYQNETHYGACRIMQDYNGTRLEIMDTYRSWAGTAAGGVIAVKQFPFNNDQWYTLKASAIGDQLTCEVVGHPETRLTGTWTGPGTGTVGLRGTHIPIDYKNMVVEFE